MKRVFIAVVIVIILLPASAYAQKGWRWTMAFWNVENYFDTRRDTLKDDCAFTPEGDNHWTPRRYQDKQNKIFKTIAAMQWPVVVGMAEVENDHVLRDLCRNTPLRKMSYDFVHFESPDQRGIDCALLYRKGLFEVFEARNIYVSDTAEGFYTRDLLLVGGVLNDTLGTTDTCYILVNHWPSKRGGATADRYRMAIAQRLRHTMDSLQRNHPAALVLAMGDFNATSDEEAISRGLGFDGEERNPEGFYNLMHSMPRGEGSYKYRDTWSTIDQMIANRKLTVELFAPDYLLVDDEKYMGRKPFRTYTGMTYLGGYSDHLPVMVRIP